MVAYVAEGTFSERDFLVPTKSTDLTLQISECFKPIFGPSENVPSATEGDTSHKKMSDMKVEGVKSGGP